MLGLELVRVRFATKVRISMRTWSFFSEMRTLESECDVLLQV